MLRLCGRGALLSAAAAAMVAAWLAPWWRPRGGLRLLGPEELARYRGGPGDPGLYLALLGRVYDVSRGRRHYEPGAHYSGLAGRDASRAFVTGDYTEAGLVDDVTDLSFSEMLTLRNWLSFYEKNYVFVGRVIGRFYGKDGLPTPELTQVEAMMTKGLEANEQEQREKQKFPPCNSEWSATKGSRFWCSQKSSRDSFLVLSEPGSHMSREDLGPGGLLGAQAWMQVAIESTDICRMCKDPMVYSRCCLCMSSKSSTPQRHLKPLCPGCCFSGAASHLDRAVLEDQCLTGQWVDPLQAPTPGRAMMLDTESPQHSKKDMDSALNREKVVLGNLE